jgi:tungstate transport system substrate-binding protein
MKILLKILVTTLSFTLLAAAMTAVSAGEASVNKLIRLATTTSTDNSGLLNHLLPAFTADSGYEVHVIAVGTGKALRMGRDGDVDVVLVHAPEAEARFVEAGYGDRRHAVMYNDFVIVGPGSDPAGISAAKTVSEAMGNIAASESLFVSRGDDSGTHKKELKLWQGGNVTPRGEWYREAGQGMGKVLQIASELDAYTLTDRGTWLAYRNKSSLKVLFEGDQMLHNPYGIIAVSASRYADINHRGALALIEWITSPKGQQLIGDFRIDGTQLFIPMADSGSDALPAPAR